MSKKIRIGTYRLGLRTVRLFLEPESNGGRVFFTPADKGTTIVEVGTGSSFDECLGILFHEAYEAVLVDLQTQYMPVPNFAESSANYVFIATHEQLDEAHQRVSRFVNDVYEPLKKAAYKWADSQKKKKVAKRRKKV